jgi:uncharacterized zinc-type alcohol dehydrogenase-like protein
MVFAALLFWGFWNKKAKGVKVGQKVGVGWTAESCMHCRHCLSGEQHLCAQAVPTIVGHRGGGVAKDNSEGTL